MQKRKINIFLFLLILCMSLFSKVDALERGQKGYVTSNLIEFKDRANYEGNNVLTDHTSFLDIGDEVTLISADIVPSKYPNRCKTGFYHINFYWPSKLQDYQGYICADHVTFQVDSEKYKDEFKDFPRSYWEKLTILKDAHPNWKFTAYPTNLNFEDVITAESIVGKSYIQFTKGINPIYLSLDGGSYNPETKTYIEQEAGGWYAANKKTVAYYMDPRNFLDEINIFMFENLGYNSAYQTIDVVNTIFGGTDLLNYSNSFMKAANYNGNSISPISLAARSRQEVVTGNGTLSDSANGSTYNGEKVYNFFNIGAYSSCKNPVLCGLEYAYNKGWKDPETAILGGATEIAAGYINQKQNTLYFQKFNVTSNKYGNYAHQYMTNIKAPVSEASSTQAAYKKISGLLSKPIEFTIPIYNQMPEEPSRLPTEVEQDDLDHATDIPEVPNSIDISTMINAAGLGYDGTYITKVSVGTTANTIISKLKSINSHAEVIVTSNGKQISGNETLGTMDIVKITSGSESKALKIVIYGDVNGDSKITILDLLRVQKSILSTVNLSDGYLKAADVNKDGKVTILDLLRVQKHILGTASIEQ